MPGELWARIGQSGHVRRLIGLARDEDLGEGADADEVGDVTSAATIDPSATCRGRVVLREAGVVAVLSLASRLHNYFYDHE